MAHDMGGKSRFSTQWRCTFHQNAHYHRRYAAFMLISCGVLAIIHRNSTLTVQCSCLSYSRPHQVPSEILTVKIHNFLILALLASGSLTISGCTTVEMPKPQPPKVTVAKPLVQDVVDYADFTGTVKSTKSVEIRARVQGILETADFTDGDDVKVGAELFTIDPKPFKAKLDAANANLEKTKAALKLANANLERAKKLVVSKAVTKEEFDTKEAQRDAAEAQIHADEAAINQAAIDLGYTDIKSPIDGKVGRRLVDPGNLVGGTDNTLLTTVVSLDPMDVYFDISEPDVLEYMKWRREVNDPKVEKTIYLGLSNEEGYPHEGKLNFLDNRVDPATGTALVRGVFPNKDGFLYAGLYVRVRIPGQTQKDAVLVSEEAIGTDLGGKFVLIVGEDKIVEQRHVELGTLMNGLRVIKKGLAADEQYIIKGIQRARPGLPVDPQEGETPAPSEPAPEEKPEAESKPEPKAAPKAEPKPEPKTPSADKPKTPEENK